MRELGSPDAMWVKFGLSVGTGKSDTTQAKGGEAIGGRGAVDLELHACTQLYPGKTAFIV